VEITPPNVLSISAIDDKKEKHSANKVRLVYLISGSLFGLDNNEQF